jgi:hypothetical protein
MTALQGCASVLAVTAPSDQLTAQATEFNEAAATTDRQLIVQNVLRARDREALSFTRLTNFRSESSRQTSGGLTASVGEGPGNDTIGPTATISRSASPAFDFPVQTGQSFQRAIHTPIDLSIYRSLIEQGWQPGLLHMVLIERMRLSCAFLLHVRQEYTNQNPDGEQFHRTAMELLSQEDRHQLPSALTEDQQVALIYARALRHCGIIEGNTPSATAAPIQVFNYPDDDWAAYVHFRRWIRVLMSGGEDFLRVCARSEENQFGPPLTPTAPVDLGDVVAVAGVDSLSWAPHDKTHDWRLLQTETSNNFGISCGKGAIIPEDAGEDDPSQIQVRSFEGLLYYLGEVVRISPRDNGGVGDPGYVVTAPLQRIEPDGQLWRYHLTQCTRDMATDPCEDTVFSLHQGDDRDAVVVRHHGRSYSALYTPFGRPRGADADDRGDRTQQVIELALQLLGQLQEAEDLPTTPVVAVTQ